MTSASQRQDSSYGGIVECLLVCVVDTPSEVVRSVLRHLQTAETVENRDSGVAEARDLLAGAGNVVENDVWSIGQDQLDAATVVAEVRSAISLR